MCPQNTAARIMGIVETNSLEPNILRFNQSGLQRSPARSALRGCVYSFSAYCIPSPTWLRPRESYGGLEEEDRCVNKLTQKH